MKLTKSLATILGSFAFIGGSAFGNTVDLLSSNGFTNTGFESGTSPWILAPSGYTIQQSTTYAHAGTHSLEFALSGNQSGNSGNNANISTNLLSTGGDISGQTVTGGAWFYMPSSDPMVSPEDIELRIYWYNGTGGALTPNSTSSTVMLPSASTDTWQHLTINAVAPTGTQKVNFQVIFRTGANPSQTTGSVYMDDAALTVPEPASLSLVGLGGLALLRRRKIGPAR